MKASDFKEGTIFLDANDNVTEGQQEILHDEDNEDCKCGACELDRKEQAKWMKLFKAGGGISPYPVTAPSRRVP